MAIKPGIVGWGPVGKTIYRCLKELAPDWEEPRLLARTARDDRIDGKPVSIQGLGERFTPEKLSLFEGLDVVLFAGREGEGGAAREWREPITEAYPECYCIDNGADYRLDPDVPLVVPEINLKAVTAETKYIASPNCSTIQMCLALAPLHEVARVKRVVVTTFQSVSGWGGEAQDELKRQLRQLDPSDLGQPVGYDPRVFRQPIANNCLPHIDSFLDNGYTKEELKMLYETRRILGDDTLQVTATCVRVPVEIGHAEAINVEFKGEMNAETALKLWSESAQRYGIVVIDDEACKTPWWPRPPEPKEGSYAGHAYAPERAYPTQRDVLHKDYRNKTLVGRTRNDYTQPNTISFWCVADNLRRGAATNVVKIALGLAECGLIG